MKNSNTPRTQEQENSSKSFNNHQPIEGAERDPLYRRPIDRIQSEDLNEISSLEEGWFVEFKEKYTDSQKISKSISSFANAYGGLLVIGVTENQKTRRMASFSPMSFETANDVITKIRQAVDAHIRPCPIFYSKMLELAVSDARDDERWIVLISIPAGNNGPYLHSSGVIYTRKGDSASAVGLNDLGVLDRIFSDGKNKRRSLTDRIDFLGSQNESNFPRIELIIFLEPDPAGAPPRHPSFSEFQKIATTPIRKNTPSILNNQYPLDTSYIARRTEGRIGNIGLLWDYDCDRHLHFISIPLATYTWQGDKFTPLPHATTNLTSISEKLPKLDNNGNETVFVVELTYALYFIAGLLRHVQHLHNSAGHEGILKINARVAAIRQSVVYVDLPRYGIHSSTAQLPYAHRDTGYLFPISDISSWMNIEKGNVLDNDFLNIDIINSIAIFSRICKSAGITEYVTWGVEDVRDNVGLDHEDISNLLTKLLSSSFSYTNSENPKAGSNK